MSAVAPLLVDMICGNFRTALGHCELDDCDGHQGCDREVEDLA
jgi:hypothetical protein